MNRFFALFVLAFLWANTACGLVIPQGGDLQSKEQEGQLWDCQLESPGGSLPFQVFVTKGGAFWVDDKLVRIPTVKISDQRWELGFDHYNSKITASWDQEEKTMKGLWKKRKGPKKWSKMKFQAKRSASKYPNFEPEVPKAMKPFVGKWEVAFSSSEDLAILLTAGNAKNRKFSTFMTTTGDYRYLRHRIDSDSNLWLSCFDGAHAFLFRAEKRKDGTLAGHFWSSDSWHETWTAARDPNAKLPNAFSQTKHRSSVDLSKIEFPGLDGKKRSLTDPTFQGDARIIYVFGSWCPNCHDAAAYFKTLQKKYGKRGLKILGLAFEVTGDFQADRKQVEDYVKRHGVTYPILIAGLSDKKEASKSIPFLDKVRSYPTTIFLDRQGKVVKIHTGFTGPATGAAYENLQKEFESTIERLLK